MNWRWISLASLLAALVIGYGALIKRGGDQVTRSEALTQPGYYLKDAVISEMQADGSLGMRLIAERIEQRPQDDSITMSTVRVGYFRAPGEQWHLAARQGFVPANSRTVELKGDVELRPAAGDTASFLRAEALAIDTARNVAYSMSSPVRIRLGQHAMTVKSFVADLNSEKIRLESVNGRLEPQ